MANDGDVENFPFSPWEQDKQATLDWMYSMYCSVHTYIMPRRARSGLARRMGDASRVRVRVRVKARASTSTSNARSFHPDHHNTHDNHDNHQHSSTTTCALVDSPSSIDPSTHRACFTVVDTRRRRRASACLPPTYAPPPPTATGLG